MAQDLWHVPSSGSNPPAVPAVNDRPSYAMMPPGGSDDGSVGLLEYAGMLWRKKGTLVLVTLLGVLIALAISLTRPRVYQSVATVEVQGVNDNFLNLRDVDPTAALGASSSESYVETQAQILQQDFLLERVVKRLRLDQRPDLTPRPGPLDGLRSLFGERVTQPRGIERAIRSARESLKVVPAHQSRIIRVYYDSGDPQLAADFANALVQALIEQNVEERWRAAQQTKEWLRPQLDELKSRLERSQAELQAYSKASGLMLTPDQENLATEKLRQLQTELSKAQAERIAKEPFYALSSQGRTEGVAESNTKREYDLRLTELRRQLADLESLLLPENYKVVRLKAQIAELESARQKEITSAQRGVKNDYEATRSREKLLSAAYEKQAGLVSNLSSKMIHYNTLKHEADTTRQVYEAMLQKVSEAGIASAIRPSNIRLVDHARPADTPYKPNTPLNVTIGLFAGLLLGVGCATMLEQTNRRLSIPGDAAVAPQVIELGAIPAAACLNPAARRLLRTSSRDGLVERITWEQKDSLMSESFRAVLTSLLSPARNGHAPRVLVITSPLPGEGKTTVTSNLALALAEIKRRVLLIDGDLRRPRLHTVFDVDNTWGLSGLLSETNAALELPMDQLVKKTSVPNLWVLPSGPGPDSTFPLLYSPGMLRLFCRFREEFDHVLVDAPPSLEFADARILARNADGIILVFRANRTDRKTAVAAAHQMLRDGIPVLGTILNDWDPKAGATYGYSDYYCSYRARAPRQDRPLLESSD